MWPLRKLFLILRNLLFMTRINIYVLKFIGFYIKSFSNTFFIRIYIISKKKLQYYVLKFSVSNFNLYQIFGVIGLGLYLFFWFIIAIN